MSSSPNRKRDALEPLPSCSNEKRAKKTVCQYGTECFRKNPVHFKEFFHPHLNALMAYKLDKNIKLANDLQALLTQSLIQYQLDLLKDNNIEPLSEEEMNMCVDINEETPLVCLYKNDKTLPTSNSEVSVNISKNNINLTAENKPSSSGDCKRTPKTINIHEYCPVVAPRGEFATKLKNSAPFYIFYTTITDSHVTHIEPLSVTFQELLDYSLGDLNSSLQINFMVDISWLMAQYIFAGYRNKPLTVLYGDDSEDLRTINKKIPTVMPFKIQMNDPFGTHHTKMMLFYYEDKSMRIVVSTANLYEDDWHNRVQGLWISPTCPPLSDSEGSNSDEGNGPTNFKKDLLNYLHSYKLTALQEWIGRVRRTDFSHINVCLVTSVPGTHRSTDYEKYGHAKMASLLSKHCSLPSDMGWNSNEWSIICQCSSIGSLGPKPDAWLGGQIRNSFSRLKNQMLMNVPNISVVYPSLENVRKSYDHLLGGGCLPYGREIHMKQLWLENFLCQWKALSRHRDRAMPHIKTYCRIAPDLSELAWFHLTSANLSKAAWGISPLSGDKRITIKSYEVGVLFLPKFVSNQQTFLLDTGNVEISEKNAKKYFPFPYDLPLTPYSKTDSPFFSNYLRE